MRSRRVGVAFAVAFLTLGIGVAPDARADNTTCENAEFLLSGSIASASIASGTPRHYKVPVVAGRSYSFTSWAPFQDKGDGAFLFTQFFHIDDACSMAAFSVSGSDGEPTPFLPDGFHQGDHDSIIPDFTGLLYVKIVASASVTLRFRAVETTLFSPWWFTGGTNQAFVEIRNTTNIGVSYTATFVSSDGTTCGEISAFLPPNGNTAIRINSLTACDGTSGSAQLAFKGQLNALVANTTTIDGTQATSFDAPFKGRMEWGTWKR